MTLPSDPLAFILMPFDAEFEGVYEDLIQTPLESAGFTVRRADSLLNQRSVLQDIVSGIADADLIIADLSDLNANVMYELGLAHGLGKRTVMITKSLETLPFDLRVYRVNEYSINFRVAGRLADTLKDIARAVLAGEADFGNPVQDYAPGSLRQGAQVGEPPRARESRSAKVDQEDDPDSDMGLLEALELMQQASGHLQETTDELGESTRNIGDKFTKHTTRLNQVQKNLGPDKALQPSLVVMRETAKDLETYANDVEPRNERLRSALSEVVVAANTIARLRSAENEGDRDRIRDELASLDQIDSSLVESYFSTSGFAEVIASLPPVESHLTRAGRHAARAVSETASIIEISQGEFSRVRALLEERLHEGPSKDEL